MCPIPRRIRDHLEAASGAEPREIRVLVQHGATVRRAFKLAFSKTDASIYVGPYARRPLFLRSRHAAARGDAGTSPLP